ncbi:MAG: hypothetical protein PHS41_12205 [Victivallaceae bacterium]|nr:hypothetical protein [Victivallaceae bacterium]
MTGAESMPFSLEEAAKLDASGFVPGATESADAYFQRVERLRSWAAELRTTVENLPAGETLELAGLFPVGRNDLIPAEILSESARITEQLYDFTSMELPGFFTSKTLGLLWGGCSFSDDETVVFILRKSYRNRKRFLIYDRDELLSHELCHAARSMLDDPMWEEYFAYQTAKKRLRRWLGCAFLNGSDAVLFLLPVMLLPITQALQNWMWEKFPVWPFWILAACYPLFLGARVICFQRIAAAALRNLKKIGAVKPLAVLYRCRDEEIRFFATCPDPERMIAFIDRQSAEFFRWQVIRKRFFGGNRNEATGTDRIS